MPHPPQQDIVADDRFFVDYRPSAPYTQTRAEQMLASFKSSLAHMPLFYPVLPTAYQRSPQEVSVYKDTLKLDSGCMWSITSDPDVVKGCTPYTDPHPKVVSGTIGKTPVKACVNKIFHVRCTDGLIVEMSVPLLYIDSASLGNMILISLPHLEDLGYRLSPVIDCPTQSTLRLPSGYDVLFERSAFDAKTGRYVTRGRGSHMLSCRAYLASNSKTFHRMGTLPKFPLFTLD